MKNKNILLLLGPNLNITGTKEKGMYGEEAAERIRSQLQIVSESLGMHCDIFQSNWEGAIIDKIHECRDTHEGYIINAGALACYSYALREAISLVKVPCIEVNTANVYAKEKSKPHSIISDVCVGQITGFGQNSYFLAIQALKELI